MRDERVLSVTQLPCKIQKFEIPMCKAFQVVSLTKRSKSHKAIILEEDKVGRSGKKVWRIFLTPFAGNEKIQDSWILKLGSSTTKIQISPRFLEEKKMNNV
jgi:hypothetical protein